VNPYIGSLEKIFQDASIAARSSEAVLLLGETGVGKEILARFIHERSRRHEQPFLPINCAAVPTHLLESELFGTEKGAFTGAVQTRRGLLEQAEGGTVLMDEVADISPEAQAKLLRAIETKEILPLGGSKYRKIDVRFIAATNCDMKSRVETGQFRRDLYYRLSIFQYTMPPLRQRMQDLPALIDHLIQQMDLGIKLSPPALELLLCYPWPGNVRELKNVLSFAGAGAQNGIVEPQNLPEDILTSCPHPGILAGSHLRDKTACFEAHMLASLMKQYKDPVEAAKQMGIGVRTLYRKLKKYGIDYHS
jgi:transcriptional regulator with PAS, ATPase and Fis domain